MSAKASRFREFLNEAGLSEGEYARALGLDKNNVHRRGRGDKAMSFPVEVLTEAILDGKSASSSIPKALDGAGERRPADREFEFLLRLLMQRGKLKGRARKVLGSMAMKATPQKQKPASRPDRRKLSKKSA